MHVYMHICVYIYIYAFMRVYIHLGPWVDKWSIYPPNVGGCCSMRNHSTKTKAPDHPTSCMYRCVYHNIDPLGGPYCMYHQIRGIPCFVLVCVAQ